MDRTDKVLIVVAGLAFIYAVLGNYVALPGYLRFLDRGGTSAAGNTMDLAVVIGATKTILWMLAFNIGAMCLYFSGLRTLPERYLRVGILIGVVWLLFWGWPDLPRAGFLFYLVFGTAILGLIGLASIGVKLDEGGSTDQGRRRFLLMTSLLFFAMGTWDVCGLGSTGRILHPDQVVLERSQQLLSAQTTKLMLAFLFAWLSMAMAYMPLPWRQRLST
jgi:hypothetical protein